MKIALLFLLVQINQASPAYFSNPDICDQGIVASDNYCSALYLFDNETPTVIAATPGCGRYFRISPDERYIAYNDDRDQIFILISQRTFRLGPGSNPSWSHDSRSIIFHLQYYQRF